MIGSAALVVPAALSSPRTLKGKVLKGTALVAGDGVLAASIKKKIDIYNKYHPEDRMKWNVAPEANPKFYKFEQEEMGFFKRPIIKKSKKQKKKERKEGKK